MPYVAVATEASHVDASGGAANIRVVDTPAGSFDSITVRSAFDIDTTSHHILPAFTALTDLYVHWNFWQTNPEGNRIILTLGNGPDGDANACIRINQTSGTEFTLQYHDGTTWQNVGVVSSVGSGVVETYDLHVNITGTDIQYRIFKNGGSVLNTTSGTSTRFTDISQLWLGDSSSASTNNVGTQITRLSEIIVADEPTVGWKVVSNFPIADGTYSDFTGNYLNVDEFDYNADVNDSIQTTEANRRSSFQLSDIHSSLTSYEVKGVTISGHVQNNTASTITDQHFFIRVGGIDYNAPDMGIVKDGQVYRKSHTFYNHPGTNAPFTIADIQAMEAGIETV